MVGTFTKIIQGNELYLYNAKGQLIFKRWLNHQTSIVFDVMPYRPSDSLVSITDEGTKFNTKN